jgi:hypothetical protein
VASQWRRSTSTSARRRTRSSTARAGAAVLRDRIDFDSAVFHPRTE